MHSVILSRKGALDQFVLGLGPLLEQAKKHPELIKPLLVGSESSEVITPDKFKKLIVFHGVEEKVKGYFLEFIEKEGKDNTVHLLMLPYYSTFR